LSAVQFGKLPDRNGFVGRQLSDESLRIGTGQPSDQIVDKSSHVGKIGAGDRPRYSRNCAPALTPRARTPRRHIDLSIVQIAGHLPTDPTRKRWFVGLALKLNFRNHDPLEDAAINVDVPDRAGVLDKKALFLQRIITTNGRKYPFGFRNRDFILKLRTHNPRPRSLDRDRRGFSR